MSPKAVKAIFLVLLGCMLNNIFLEYIIKLDPGSGHLITFCQFLLIAIHGFVFTSRFGTVKPVIPLSGYLTLVFLFFTTSVVNNWAFAFNIPVPLHMIFRAGSLIANMILGIVIVKRKYTLEKYLSVLLITLGIIICTLYSSTPDKPVKCLDCDPLTTKETSEVSADHFFWWVIGILLLTGALLLSAGMGIFQEQLYMKYGKHPEEALYYTHMYSLPGFLIYSSSLLEHGRLAFDSELYTIPFVNMTIPLLWGFLILNIVTQFMCISNVYVLTTECQSLTVTLVITLRKFFSLLFSIIYFQNPFTIYHWVGTMMVFAGTLMFSETHHKMKALLTSPPKTDKKRN